MDHVEVSKKRIEKNKPSRSRGNRDLRFSHTYEKEENNKKLMKEERPTLITTKTQDGGTNFA
jgi:hypothetical protein